MKRITSVAGCFLLAVISCIPVYADVWPGVVKGLPDLRDAYDGLQSIKKAADDAEQLKVKPTADPKGVENMYAKAVTDFTSSPLTPSPPSPAAPQFLINSCADRSSAMSTMQTGLNSIHVSINDVNNEIGSINQAISKLDETTKLVYYIRGVIPDVEKLQPFGHEVAQDFFTMTERINASTGKSRGVLDKRLNQDKDALVALSASNTAWNNAYNQVINFSSAPMPQGTYTQSCNQCKVDCALLECNCRRINQTYTRSQVNYISCHSVENNNGQLQCGR
jgi:hypothetical protein